MNLLSKKYRNYKNALMIFIVLPSILLYRRLSNRQLLFLFLIFLGFESMIMIVSSIVGLTLNAYFLPALLFGYLTVTIFLYGAHRFLTNSTKTDSTTAPIVSVGMPGTSASNESLSPAEFEQMVAELFKKLGYTIHRVNHSHDQGADIVMSLDSERYCVQVKKYKGSVGNSAIQQVAASLPYYRADRGVVVTTGTFTASAVALAKSNDVVLIDGPALSELLRQNGFLH